MASWLSVKDVATAAETERFLKAGLHPGESEAIVLAVELGRKPC
jgi:predicted nucleic acid-binding protein